MAFGGSDPLSRGGWLVPPKAGVRGTYPTAVLELVPAEELNGVLHVHHAEVAAATRDAVVHGVAEQFLGLPWELGCDRRRDRQVVVLFCPKPPQAVAQVRTTPRDLGGVGPSS